MMKNILTALIFSFCSFAYAQDIKTTKQDLAHEIGPVDLKSGVTQNQASIIAQYYCRHHIAGCGPVKLAADRNSDWEFTPLTGVAGSPNKNNISVGKHTAIVSWGTGPSVNLVDLISSKETAPEPINKGNSKFSYPSASVVKIQFNVLPTGTVANARFKKSSLNDKCDREARRVVESWRFPARKQSVELVTNMWCAQ